MTVSAETIQSQCFQLLGPLSAHLATTHKHQIITQSSMVHKHSAYTR